MVAIKKSIAIAAFAVAGVNANRCDSCPCGSPAPINKKEIDVDGEGSDSAVIGNGEDVANPVETPAEKPDESKFAHLKGEAKDCAKNAEDKMRSATNTVTAACSNGVNAVKNGANSVKDSTKSKYQSMKEMLTADNRFYNQTFAANKEDAKETAKKAFRGGVDTAKAGVETLKENKVAAISTTVTVATLAGAFVFADKLGLETQKQWIVDTMNSTLQSVSTPEARALLKQRFFDTMSSMRVSSVAACTSCMDNTVSLKNKSVKFVADKWATLTKANFLATLESLKTVPAETMQYMGELYTKMSGWSAEHKAALLEQLREKKEWTKESVGSLFQTLSAKFGYNKTA